VTTWWLLLCAMGWIAFAAVNAPGHEPSTKRDLEQQTTASTAPLAAFDVASVRENKSDEQRYSNFPLNPGPQYGVRDGLLIARNMVLLQYIVFAWKPDMFQIQMFRDRLPDWARTSRFDIQARAPSNPTKDEMRLMMRSLLIERFNMKVHYETREVPIYALILAKPGKIGPDLKPHPVDDPSCLKMQIPQPVAGAYPGGCGLAAAVAAKAAGSVAVGGYNMTMATVATALGGAGSVVDRPVVDKTGLMGKFDFTVEFAPETTDRRADDGGSFPSQSSGPTFYEALREQLGLRVVAQKGVADVIVIDHLERLKED
jgi:uncharacterized protein (TIGR03435 family)